MRHDRNSNGNVAAFLGVTCAWQSSRSQLGLLLGAAMKLDGQQPGNRAWRHLGMTEHLISLAPKAAVASQQVCCWVLPWAVTYGHDCALYLRMC